MDARWQSAISIAIGAALAGGVFAGASSAPTEPVPAVRVVAATTASPDDGMTVGRAAFAGVGVVGLVVLVAALRAPSSRPSHRARRRRLGGDEAPPRIR